jgi:hypothetical protein
MNTKVAISLIAISVFSSAAFAQIRAVGGGHSGVGGGRSSVGVGSSHVFVGRGIRPAFGHGFPAHGFGRRVLFPGYFPYYPDYYDEPAPAQAPAPQVVVVQSPQQQAQAQVPSPPEPLVIEWQGDHFVRMTLAEKINSQGVSPDYSQKNAAHPVDAGKKPADQQARELPPAVLVFRDGHQEEVSNYTIINRTLYTKSDFWTTGSWNKQIQLTSLDIPATMKLNQERGLRFSLPASPNEIFVRP